MGRVSQLRETVMLFRNMQLIEEMQTKKSCERKARVSEVSTQTSL